MEKADAYELVLELAFDRGDLDYQLEASKGSKGGADVYRPFGLPPFFGELLKNGG